MTKGFWRRCVASVTDFAHKYRFDPFLRTEVNVIVLQVAFAGFVLIVVASISSALYHDASSAVSQGISQALTPDATPAVVGNSVISDLRSMRSRTVMFAITAIIITVLIFTFIIIRVALTPTRRALESQKQFIGNVAHELRTPLSVSKTNIEVELLSPNIDDVLRKSLLDTVAELDRMSEIINNLLTLSSSVRPERMEFRNVDLGEIADTAIQKLRELANPKHLEIETRMSERRIVLGNATALEQVIMNLLKNSIQYTPRYGHILVTVEPVYPDFMEITVRDSGKGIARKDLFRIFEPYYRADLARTRADGGSGLGLTIVSELVKLHNGKITVRSTEGRGTTITILLPAGHDISPTTVGKQPDAASEIAVDYTHGLRRTP